MMVETQGDWMFTIVPIFIGAIFILVVGVIIFTISKSIGTWSENNQSPRVNAYAKVVTKRTSVKGGGETNARSLYYVTFEFDSGDRLELRVDGKEYGQLVEGDNGDLSFQGTRYLGFTRHS
ncbi:DUF2500 domain-containing protein [Mesobacillus subterraneus]|uniref:DUF2500 domain-containing protein n=1 Tax=Mesobacillus subterraneus TaxID=285983 RepID=UPI001CFE5B6A|nr:DUF2500 domain-containing protein [Mesobacillus subterraneus]WLR57477.1 DUF2500 domain-containing protein [Mesobacillus subterraneus]